MFQVNEQYFGRYTARILCLAMYSYTNNDTSTTYTLSLILTAYKRENRTHA